MRNPFRGVNKKIMAELLEQSGVKENVAQMNPETLEWFKKTLVSEGVYDRYVQERKAAKSEAGKGGA